MFIREFKRSAFERQIDKAVSITREAKKQELLNSKAEYNQQSLPRLITRIGDKEKEIKEWEKEKKEEKDDIIEQKIRKLRKEMNRQRLTNERQNPNKKRQKLDNSNYISIKDNWGPPPLKKEKEG